MQNQLSVEMKFSYVAKSLCIELVYSVKVKQKILFVIEKKDNYALSIEASKIGKMIFRVQTTELNFVHHDHYHRQNDNYAIDE